MIPIVSGALGAAAIAVLIAAIRVSYRIEAARRDGPPGLPRYTNIMASLMHRRGDDAATGLEVQRLQRLMAAVAAIMGLLVVMVVLRG